MKAKCLVAMEFSRTHTCSVPTASPMPGRAAERADLVTEFDGTPVRDAADLQLRLALAPLPAVWRAVPRLPPASPSRYCPPHALVLLRWIGSAGRRPRTRLRMRRAPGNQRPKGSAARSSRPPGRAAERADLVT